MCASHDPDGGMNGIVRLAASMSFHALPLLPASEYCEVATAGNTRPGRFGISWTVSRVGEYSPAIGPTPAKIDPGSGLLTFQRSVIAYGVEAATGTAACMLAALGLNVPAKPALSFQRTT